MNHINFLNLHAATTPGTEPPPEQSSAEVVIQRTDQIVKNFGGRMGIPSWGMYALVIGKIYTPHKTKTLRHYFLFCRE